MPSGGLMNEEVTAAGGRQGSCADEKGVSVSRPEPFRTLPKVWAVSKTIFHKFFC